MKAVKLSKPLRFYLNCGSGKSRETIDEFTQEAGQSRTDFLKYVRSMIQEYHLAGMNVYRSIRKCKDWA